MLPLVARSQTETPPKCNASAAPGLEFQTDPLRDTTPIAFSIATGNAVSSICSGITRQLYANGIARQSFQTVRGRRTGKVEAELQYLAAALMRR